MGTWVMLGCSLGHPLGLCRGKAQENRKVSMLTLCHYLRKTITCHTAPWLFPFLVRLLERPSPQRA